MSHVQIKATAVAATALALSMASCGDAEQRQAEALLTMATEAAADGDYDQSIVLIDSIDKAYPRQTGTRRKAMHLRATSTEAKTVGEIAAMQSAQALLKAEADSLQRLITRIDNPLEPYYVATQGKRMAGSNGLEARMAPDGMFYMLSSLRNPRVGHTHVTVSDGIRTASTATIEPDGERNDRSLGYEIIHYMMGECDSVGALIATAPSGVPITITFVGDKSTSIQLPADQTEGIATLWRAAANVRGQRHAALELQRLEKQLELARTHAARTFEE